MKTEDQIKQKAEKFISSKFSGVDLTVAGDDFVQDKINDFMAAVNIGRELGMKEAFEWISIDDTSPEVKDKPYWVLVKDESKNKPRLPVEEIAYKEDVQYIELNYTHFRYLDQEDMP